MSLDPEEEKEHLPNIINVNIVKKQLKDILHTLDTFLPECSAQIKGAVRSIDKYQNDIRQKLRMFISYGGKRYRVVKRLKHMNAYISNINMEEVNVVNGKRELEVPLNDGYLTEDNINDFCTLSGKGFDKVSLDRKISLFTLFQYFAVADKYITRLTLSICTDVLRRAATIMNSPAPEITTDLNTHELSFSVWTPKVGLQEDPTKEFLQLFMDIIKGTYDITYDLFKITHKTMGQRNIATYTCDQATFITFVHHLRTKFLVSGLWTNKTSVNLNKRKKP